MINPNKLMACVIAIVVLSLCAGALLAGAWLGSQAAERHAVPAKFRVGDCYRYMPPLHRWSAADGMVFDMDTSDYLVVDAMMMGSKRTIEPAYVGTERSIVEFDRQYEAVGCPSKW